MKTYEKKIFTRKTAPAKVLKLSPPVWNSADGRAIPYQELTDDHLKAILRDGYRSPYLKLESKRRGFEYPKTLFERMEPEDFAKWLEALASCALSDNKEAGYLMDLWETDRGKFAFAFNRFLMRIKSLEGN